ncbi:MAG: prepilin peptidase [Deltaproteobacteria bacterium]|nr:prepilin peptidase [Deltaproteobacteria bacterium]
MSQVTVTDVFLALLLAVAVFTDVRSSRIPNALTFTGMAVGVAYQALQGAYFAGVLGILAAFVPGFLFWRLGRAWGAGDVKLLMAAGALLGPWEALRLVVFVILVSIPFSLWKLWRMGRLRSFFTVVRSGIRKDTEGPAPVSTPFAVAIALAWIAFRLLPDWFHMGP